MKRADLPGQAVELAGRTRQAGGGDDRGLVGEVGVGGLAGVARRPRRAGARARARAPSAGNAFSSISFCSASEPNEARSAYTSSTSSAWTSGTTRAAVRDQLDQAVALEQPQRVADRPARDAELLRERDLLQALAGLEPAVDDRVAQRRRPPRRRWTARVGLGAGARSDDVVLRPQVGALEALDAQRRDVGERRAARTRSRSSSPVAGPCRKPWPRSRWRRGSG